MDHEKVHASTGESSLIKAPLYAVAIAAAFCPYAFAPAQTTTPAGTQQPKQEEPKRDPKSVAYDTAIKDLKRIDGPFPMYLRKNDILVEISESQLGKVMLCETNLATGISSLPYQAGDPVGADEVEAYRIDRA